ncbi:MAG: hypothetical protein ACE5HB_07545 [Terriglobia bacterium]
MAEADNQRLRELLQQFVDARLDAPQLFARAGKLLPPGADATEALLLFLAEANFRLRLPADRKPLIRRLEQLAQSETSYSELDLWCFCLEHTEALAPEAGPRADAELRLLREIVNWIEEWEDEAERPDPEEVGALARILAQERDPQRCLEQLAAALARLGRE